MNTMLKERGSKTALVTGASGGIGRELAELFARDGYALVLVARREQELAALAREWEARYSATIQTVALDLGRHGAADRLVEELDRRGIVVDILVNNAGFAQFGPFADVDPEQQIGMVELNVVTLTRLTRLLLPSMLRRRWGRVLNVASTAAFMPGPLMSVYYASKAYVLLLSEGINEELRGSGVSVSALCPGPTRTGFQERASMQRSRVLTLMPLQDAASVARAGYIGLLRGEPVVLPDAMSRLQALAPRLVPRRWLPALVRRIQAPRD